MNGQSKKVSSMQKKSNRSIRTIPSRESDPESKHNTCRTLNSNDGQPSSLPFLFPPSLTENDRQLLQREHRPPHPHLTYLPKIQRTQHAHRSNPNTSHRSSNHQPGHRAREGLDERSEEEDLAGCEEGILPRVDVCEWRGEQRA